MTQAQMLSSLGPPELRRIGGCHARSSLPAPRASRYAARTSCLVRHRRYLHVGGGGTACSLALGVSPPRGPGTSPLAHIEALPSLALWIGEPLAATWEPLPLLWIEEPPPPRVRVTELWPPQPPAGGRRLVRSQATIVVARAWVGVRSYDLISFLFKLLVYHFEICSKHLECNQLLIKN
jgi:hypothetical protein